MKKYIEWKPVTQERYDEMLGVLPPAIMTGLGFLVGEPWRHVRCSISQLSVTPAFQAFAQKDGECWEALEPLTVAEFQKLDRHTLAVQS